MTDANAAAPAPPALSSKTAIIAQAVVEGAKALGPYALAGGCVAATAHYAVPSLPHVIDLVLGAALMAINPGGKRPQP